MGVYFMIDIQALWLSLELAGKGMLAIFVVITAIYICVAVMLRLTNGKNNKN